ncbi:histidine phosphatase family protein [Herbiconiux sp. YIM B11900]|uniref:histidine phosphatase family protein n=1 Tax=Herbiconiux sp. YIM B11900 TaxID=3404131 RepID=UPI003F8521CD
MRLLLIRHGQTIDNVNGAVSTAVPGPGLTDLGLRQAAAVPGALGGEHIDAIAVSTMLRTQLTAAPLAAATGIEPQVVDGLFEITAGELEGRTDQDAVQTYMRTIFSWWTDFEARIPGGESGTEFHARYDRAITSLYDAHPDGTVAVFSHGAAIRTWASWSARNIDADFSRGRTLENTGIVTLEGSPAEGWIATHWQGTPLGGAALEDLSAPDPTGEATAK